MIFNFVRTITFDAFKTIHTTHKGHVFSFPAILALENFRIHVCILDCCNVATNIKASVNEILGLRTTLRVLNINLDNSHVRFGKGFDNIKIRGEDGVVEDVSYLKDFFQQCL